MAYYPCVKSDDILDALLSSCTHASSSITSSFIQPYSLVSVEELHIRHKFSSGDCRSLQSHLLSFKQCLRTRYISNILAYFSQIETRVIQIKPTAINNSPLEDSFLVEVPSGCFGSTSPVSSIDKVHYVQYRLLHLNFSLLL